ncbi:MAG: hypothetical protein RL885_07350 [Planctomycetota bacterium]
MSKATWLTATVLLAILLATLPLSLREDPVASGSAAMASGDTQAALELWREAADRARPDVPPELLTNMALAALASGRWTDAEIAAERLVVADAALAPLREFLQANARYGRAKQAELRADLPEAEPFAYDLAIRLMQQAKSGWIRAHLGEGEWPAARRNAERAELASSQLELKKQKKLEEQKKKTERDPPPEKPEPEEPEPEKEEIELDAAVAELPVEDVRRLIERLAQKEREKRALRQAEREKRSGPAERDW